MKTRQIVCWLLCAASPALAQVSPWSSGTYAYDGSGNVKAIGADSYVYDQVGRLVRGSADKERTGLDSHQAYTYDAFGNRLTASTTGTQCVNGCGVNVQVNNANRVTDHSATYDAAGNLKHFDTNDYTYDGAGMLVTVSSSPTSANAEYIYTAGDERLAVYTGGGNWRFTIRDLDAKVVREVTAFQSGGNTTWTWHRDHIFRDGMLLATVLPEGTQHYHLDHLATPRLVTDGTGRKLGVHVYYPFGDELSLGLGEPTSPERLKFTGHERDDESNGTSLDYMHARSYEIKAGRLLSVDPVLGNLLRPGSWNRYAYVLNNPTTYTDPTGMVDNNSVVTCSGPGGGIPCAPSLLEITVVAKDPLHENGVTEFAERMARSLAQRLFLKKPGPLHRITHDRSPDYWTVTFASTSVYGVGGGGSFTLDAHGGLYFSPVITIGTPGRGFSVTAGWLDRNDAPNAAVSDDFISGLGGAFSVAKGYAYVRTWGGPGNGWANELGWGVPGLGINGGYAIGPLETGQNWH